MFPEKSKGNFAKGTNVKVQDKHIAYLKIQNRLNWYLLREVGLSLT
jgi:hypothetical protein